ncbi:MAG: BON domain-containing protein [Vicinamibacterales bacterium]
MRTFLTTFLAAVVLLLPRPAAAQRSDADLARQAALAVRGYPQFTIFDDVNIAVANGVVTLTGRVTAAYKVKDIGERVGRAAGDERLVNQLEVLPASTTDQDLRVRIARAIYTHSTFWQYASMTNPPIHIIVERGRVTLTGAVNSEVERMMAYALAQVDGAFSVTNRLTLDGR